MSNIKIFVSHRIDLESEIIENDIYVPVRCGAYFDKEKKPRFIGDNTGDNISAKRESYCELTVQYWAWKNVEADYYGLCHYRRYLSFADQPGKADIRNQISEPYLNYATYKKYNLDNKQKMENIIKQYDVVIADSTNIQKIATANGYAKSIYEHWKACDNILIKAETVDLVLNSINKLHPEYSAIAYEYLHGKEHIGYNCYVLKKELFDKMCEFEFDVLADVEKQLDTTYYHETLNRTIGYLSEILFGIYIYSLKKSNKYKIKVQQLVFFENTEVEKKILPIENKEPMLITSSNEMIPFLEVQLRALFKKNTTSCDIIIMHYNITKENQNRIKEIVKKLSNSEIRFYNPEVWLAKNEFEFCIKNKEITNVLPVVSHIFKNYDKILYINGYTFIFGKIIELLQMSFGNNYALAVKDYHFTGIYNSGDKNLHQFMNEELKLKNPYNYIDDGVIMLNNVLIRKNVPLKKLEKYYDLKLRNFSKDIINIILEDKVKFLDGKWNYCIYAPEIDKHLNYYNPVRDFKNRKIDKDESIIIHYSYGAAPWERLEVELTDPFWEVARECDYYEHILSRIMDNKVFSVLAKVAPSRKKGAISVIHRIFPKNSRRNQLIRKVFPEGSRQFMFFARLIWK